MTEDDFKLVDGVLDQFKEVNPLDEVSQVQSNLLFDIQPITYEGWVASGNPEPLSFDRIQEALRNSIIYGTGYYHIGADLSYSSAAELFNQITDNQTRMGVQRIVVGETENE